MHIGMVTATYDADVVNGVLRMVQLYRAALEARGHQVTIFTLGRKQSDGHAGGVVTSRGLPLGDFGYYAGLGYTAEAQRLLATADIVHCHHLVMGLELAHRYANAPIVYTNHTRYDLYLGAYARLPQPVSAAVMRFAWPRFTNMADAVVAPSAGVKRVMEDFGVRAPISIIANGVDLQPYLSPDQPLTKGDLGLPGDCTLAVYCGRLSAEKDVVQLVRLFALAAQQRNDLHLLLIGKGPLAKEIEELATKYGLQDRVHLAGAIGFAEVANYLAAADFFLTASTSEVHPLTVIEAMAAGLPVVAVHSPGIDETITSGTDGILVDAADDRLVAAILALTEDTALRQRMGIAARDTSARYDINHTVDLTLALYEDLLAERPDQRRSNAHGKRRDRALAWRNGRPRYGEVNPL